MRKKEKFHVYFNCNLVRAKSSTRTISKDNTPKNTKANTSLLKLGAKEEPKTQGEKGLVGGEWVDM